MFGLMAVTACVTERSQPDPSAGQTTKTSTVGPTTGFLAFGDTGYITDRPNAAAMKEFCRTEDCRFAVMLGDNIYPDGADGSSADAQRFEDTLIKPYSDLGGTDENFRIYPALGNHDWDTSRVGAFAQISFLETTRPFFMDGPFYSVRPEGGNNQVEIFVIDTQMILAEEKGQAAWEKKDRHKSMNAYPQNEEEKGQLIWLENALEASSAKWKIPHTILCGNQKAAARLDKGKFCSGFFCQYYAIKPMPILLVINIHWNYMKTIVLQYVRVKTSSLWCILYQVQRPSRAV